MYRDVKVFTWYNKPYFAERCPLTLTLTVTFGIDFECEFSRSKGQMKKSNFYSHHKPYLLTHEAI